MAVMYMAAACNKPGSLTESEKAKWKSEGEMAVKAAADMLRSQLVKAMGDSGVVYAIDFCHTAAFPITDSAGKKSGYPISRRSLKFRNPDNKPNQMETQVLKMYSRAAEQKKELKPTLLEHDNGQLYYFQPISVQPLCLNCHGEIGKDINEATFNAIRARYPKDKAFNFKTGDLRGMWVVLLKDNKS